MSGFTLDQTINALRPSASSVATTATNIIQVDPISVASKVTNAVTSKAVGSASDARVRLSAPHFTAAQKQIYGAKGPGNILSPLYDTNGLMFPYSPSVQFSQDVTYQEFSMVHTNTDYLAYQRTPSVNLSIAGKFAIQNQQEGVYALACIHFLRVVSKMYFGTKAGANAGLPPPILWLNGYGGYMFNNLRVIVKSHTWNYDENMDLVHVVTAGSDVWLPALFTLTVTVAVQQTPNAMRSEFDLDAFRTGKLMIGKTSSGWI